MIKRFLSIFLSAILIASLIVVPRFDSYARTIGSPQYDLSNKWIGVYVLPYEGYQVQEVINYAGYDLNDIAINVTPTVREKGRKGNLKKTDVLSSDKEYTLIIWLDSYETVTTPEKDLSGFSADIINYANKDDKSFYSNVSCKSDDNDPTRLRFSCDFKVSVPPTFNLGTCVIDLTNGSFNYIDSGLNKNAMINIVSACRDADIMPYINHFDGSPTGFDVDGDEAPDFDYYNRDPESDKYGKFIKFDNSTVTENVFFSISDDKSYELSRIGTYHYKNLRIIFSNYDISDATIADIPSVEYTGQEITPLPVVSYNGKTLSKDMDYTVSYQNNINVGKASVTVTGINGYKGQLTKEFDILEIPKNDSESSSSNGNNTGSSSSNGNNTGDSSSNGNGSGANNSNDASGAGGASGDQSATVTYENEWVNGQWYGANGDTSYTALGSWKSNSKGWWFEDTSGWYPQSQWQKIDGKWYYFTANGYMDYSEYRDGYWLGSDGALVDGYYGEWKSDSTGWWFEDQSGWYPISQWVWINGNCYYFKSNGYMATSEYIDGCWVNASGVWE